LPFDSIYEALINRVPPPPNQATQAQPLSATNFLYELDKTTQDIVTALLNSQSTFVPGDSVAVPGAQEKISLKKSIALSILCEYLTVPQECQGVFMAFLFYHISTYTFFCVVLFCFVFIFFDTFGVNVILIRTANMSELRRLRRQFITYTKMHPVEDTKKIANMFVQYLNSSLQ